MKLRANKLGYTKEGRFCFLVDTRDAPELRKLDNFKDTTLLEIEVRKWKARRTYDQIKLYWKTLTYFAHDIGVFGEEEIRLMHEGIKQKYAYKKDTGLVQDGEPVMVPIGLSQCDRFEQYEVMFNGIFLEAMEAGTDMSDYLRKWEEHKKEQGEKANAEFHNNT